MLTTHLYLVPRLRIHEAVPPANHVTSWYGNYLSTWTSLPFSAYTERKATCEYLSYKCSLQVRREQAVTSAPTHTKSLLQCSGRSPLFSRCPDAHWLLFLPSVYLKTMSTVLPMLHNYTTISNSGTFCFTLHCVYLKHVYIISICKTNTLVLMNKSVSQN